MSFRTLGWFGSDCPSIPTQFFGPEIFSFAVHDYNNPLPAPQPIGGRVNFPLDIAMKIFWEAESYQIESNISATISDLTRSGSISINVPWGNIAEPLNFFPPRDRLNNAKEMLCSIKNSPPAGNNLHTLNQTLSGNRHFFSITPRPWIADNLLVFGMVFQHDIGILFPADQVFIETKTFQTQPQYGTGSWQLNSPWGNFSLPMTISRPIQISGSFSITVSGADPETRYA
jgi:hypothetical protein